MGGAQEATMTFFAPTSRAIWMISFEVVPRTMESKMQARWVLSPRSGDHGARLTIDDENVLVRELEGHSIQLLPYVLFPALINNQSA